MARNSFYDGNPGATVTIDNSVLAAEAAETAAIAAKVAALAAQTAAELAETNAETAETNAETAETNAETAETNAEADKVQTGLDRVATAADVVLAEADKVQTGLDKIATNADVVLTNADVVSAEADKVQTGLDRVATAADVVSAEADKVQTGLDRVATAADKVTTNADVVLTAADVVSAEADRVSTAASAATATTQASTATTQATASATSATASATSATAAASSETGAATSATTATSQASTATTQATAAASSATAAAASADAFDDTYLGAKSSAPTLDNDGDALTAGDLYFNTTNSKLHSYNGSAWIAITTYSVGDGGLTEINFTSADNTKLDGIEASATADQSNAEIKTAYEANSDTNEFSDAEQTKLSGIETSATADQTGAQIKTAYQAETNAFTDAQFTKLAGIETSATADQTNAEIKTAVEAASDSNTFTDADHTKLNAIEASATADQSNAEIRTAVEAATDSNVFTDTDHTKLNAIEAAADVTDATNVTAAGALMDSELAGIAAVKATTGTFLTADQTKLDTIETSATADQTNAEIKTAVQAVSDIALAGNPTTTTQSVSNNSTRVATTAYTDAQVATIVDSAPGTLNTLNELAAALGDDANFSTTTATNIAAKLPLAGGAMTGAITTNSTFDGVDIATRDAILTSTTTTAGAALPKAGGTMTGNIVSGDNVKSTWGTGADLQIWHNGSHSYIDDVGDGDLNIGASSAVKLRAPTGGELYATFNDNGAVNLYYDAALKLATTSTGIDVTGTVTADGLTINPTTSAEISGSVSGNYILKLDNTHATSGNGLRIETPSTSSGEYSLVVKSNNGSNNNLVVANNGDISFYEDTGTTPKLFWDASAESLGIGTSSPSSYNSNTSNLVIRDTGSGGITISTGASNTGYLAFNDGEDTTIEGLIAYNQSTDVMSFRTATVDDRLVIDGSGNVGIGGTPATNTKLLVKVGTNLNFEVENASSVLRLSALNDARSTNVPLQFAASEFEFLTGNVGIGTSTIANESDHKKLKISGGSGTGAGMIEFADTSNNIDGAIFADGGNLFIVADRDNATADSSIRFRVDGSSEKMRILSNGHVRIGDITSSQNVVASMLNIKSLLNVPALHLTNGGSAEALHILAGNNSSNYVIRTVDENSGADVFTVKKDGGAETSGKFDMYVSGNVGIGDTDPSEAKLSIDNILAGDIGIKLINSQDTISLYINSESTSQAAIETASKIGLVISQDLANGYAGLFTRNLSETGSYPLVKIADNNASNTQDALQIKQVGAGRGLFIDQNGNKSALFIDSESTTSSVMVIDADVLTGGAALSVYSNSDSATARSLVKIHNDHTGATGTTALLVHQDAAQTALNIQQDGAGYGLHIDQNGSREALYIDSESTGHNAILIYSKYGIQSTQDISGGRAASFERNIAEAGSNPLVTITDDHTSNTQPALKIQQDGAGDGINIDQNGNLRAIYINSESTSYDTIESYGKFGCRFEVDISGGRAGYFLNNINEAGSQPVVKIKSGSASNTQPALHIQQDGAGYGIELDYNGNSRALYIDTSTTTSQGILVNAGALTTGKAAQFYSNSSSTGTRNLVEIWNDHADSAGTTALRVMQDAAGIGLKIEQNGDNTGLYIDSGASNYNALASYGKYALYAKQDIANGYVARFERNLAEAGSQPLLELRDDHTSNTQDALKIQQDGAGKGLFIDQNGNGRALYIDSEANGNNAIEVYGKYCLDAVQDISGGRVAYFHRDLAEAGSFPLVTITDDHTSNTQPALQVQQDGAGRGLFIDQNGNGDALYIDSEAAGSYAAQIYGKYGLRVNQDISSGYAGKFYRNLAEAGSNPLVEIKDDHTSNTQPALKIQQDGAGNGINIDQNGNNTALYINSASTSTGGIIEVEGNSLTSGRVMNIVSNSLTTGNLANFYSNAANTSIRNLVAIHNDSTVATETTALKVQQDSTGLIADFNGSGGVSQNGMKTVTFSFGMGLNVATNFDIPITNTVNYFEIKAIMGYYPGVDYTTDIHGLYAYRSDSGILRVQNFSDTSSSNSGSWSVSNPDTTTLRVTKNAGAASAFARGFVEVKYRDA